MSTWVWLLAFVAIAAVAIVFTRRYLAVRGERLVQCPDNRQTAAVHVGAARKALGGDWRLADCSRWPEQRSCGRECLAQIERSPDDCLVRNVVTGWYKDKNCAVCGKGVGEIDWYERKPGVMDASGKARPWMDVPADTLPAVLATHRPICFDCCVAETFRQQHPDLVVDNPWTPAQPGA